MRHLAVADGAFRRCQAAIFEGFEDGCFRGGDAGIFQNVVRPVRNAVGAVGFKIGAFHRNGRGIDASPLA